MRRFLRTGLGLLLGGVVAHPAAAQRTPAPPAFALEEPRANPVLPAALVPFSLASEVCRRGHVPRVTLQVYNVVGNAVATLSLRDRPAVILDSIALRCGQYVGLWDGTVAKGTRAASPGLYLISLSVDGELKVSKKFLIHEP
jgi:hypothetical protein